MKYDNLLRYAIRVISAYPGNPPLHHWLKTFYREHPQMGSKDRKMVAEMAYSYYRVGHTLKALSPEQRIPIGLFLCNDTPDELLAHFQPAWNDLAHAPLEEKIAQIKKTQPAFSVEAIFPWAPALGPGVEPGPFALSFLKKPAVFGRLRPGREAKAKDLLAYAGIPYTVADDPALRFEALAFSSRTKLEPALVPDREMVIQDLGSQKTASLFPSLPSGNPGKAWDCCAASGGKSIQLADLFPGIELTVSDVRKNILENLQRRFQAAGIFRYSAFVADLSKEEPRTGPFDLIVADLPCTGSGTWSRTPEAMYFFDPAAIRRYADLQARILARLPGYLKPGGSLIYLTCSVFAEENEGNADRFPRGGRLTEVQRTFFPGYEQAADSMFGTRWVATGG